MIYKYNRFESAERLGYNKKWIMKNVWDICKEEKRRKL